MKSDSDLLFQGEWSDSNAISHRWRRHLPIAKELYFRDCAKNGVIPDKSFLVDCRPHDCRHTFLTKLFTHTEMSAIEIALISGHKSIDMLKRYANIRPSQSRHKVW
jgi:integrase